MSLLIFLLPIAGYLIGSVPSAVVVSHLMGRPDPRQDGSGNPGATNVLRLGGKWAAALTLIGDIAKGIIPVWVASTVSSDAVVITATGLCAFLGHLFPIFLKFRGGKGVATTAGVWAAISLEVFAALAVVWLVVALTTRYVSVASIVAGVSLVPILFFLGAGPAFMALAVVMAVLLVWRHRTNIGRLRRGTETRIRLSYLK